MKLIKPVIGALTLALGAFAVSEIKASKGDNPKNPDYLLILGCRVRGYSPETTLMLRAEKAAEYLRENENTLAICCGGIVHDDQYVSEAVAIKAELLCRGIAQERIILEDKSRTTGENFINAKAIIEELSPEGGVSIAFLSSEFHLLRAKALARRYGLTVSSVAADSPGGEKMKNYLRELICFPGVYIGK